MVKVLPVSVSASSHLSRETVRGSGVRGPLERFPRPRRAEGQFSPEPGRASVLVAGWETPWAAGGPSDGTEGPDVTASHPSRGRKSWRFLNPSPRRLRCVRGGGGGALRRLPTFPLGLIFPVTRLDPRNPFPAGEASVIGGGVPGTREGGAGVE